MKNRLIFGVLLLITIVSVYSQQTKVSIYALDFFQKYIPFTKMKSADGLTENLNDYVFAKNGEVYVIYLPEAIETNINLTGAELVYTVKWYNPKEGGELLNGTVKKVKGGSVVSIGFPPEKQGDWVALLTAKNKISKEITQAKPAVVSLEALSDFAINTSKNIETSYYRDESNGVLAINATDINQRNKFAKATSVFKGENGLYQVSFVTIAENDGESSYEIRVNGATVYNVTNPETTESFKTTRFELDKMYLEKNDIIEIASTAVTNGKIPENNETAYISYKVKITNPGKYYIWVKAFSSGTEDNGLHVGLDEKWIMTNSFSFIPE